MDTHTYTHTHKKKKKKVKRLKYALTFINYFNSIVSKFAKTCASIQKIIIHVLQNITKSKRV